MASSNDPSVLDGVKVDHHIDCVGNVKHADNEQPNVGDKLGQGALKISESELNDMTSAVVKEMKPRIISSLTLRTISVMATLLKSNP